jgi:3-hydroxymyristoyl/3-hydroxydecanoyl-(acyl carrier protein) dehydratase
VIPFPASLRPVPDSPGAYSLQVDAEHPAFQGHFPGHPVLPGVVQVDWALRLGAECFGSLGVFQGLEHLKFQAVIEPGERLELRLDWQVDRRELAFEYLGPTGPKSKGFARFAPAP